MRPRVAGICLAAGASTRMGSPKALLRFGDETALARGISTLRQGGCDPVVVVLGAAADEIRLAVPVDAAVRIVVNERWELGRSGSIQAGIRAAPDADAYVILPVDHPLATAGDVAALVAAFEDSRPPLVRPVHGGRGGHPILLSAALSPAILALGPDEPLRTVVRAHRAAEVLVPGSPGTTVDVNTREDYLAASSE